MAGTIILAVAGAGKTYYICHSINQRKRNLILAFTRENVSNLRRELIDAFGRIPESTTVATFDSFVYHNFILPYEPTIAQHFEQSEFISRGIVMKDPPPRRIKSRRGNYIPNHCYFKKSELRHYVDGDARYYCATLSELVLQVKKGRFSLAKRAISRLGIFYDSILIDEFQDFRAFDYDLIVSLSKWFPDVTLVGDYFQHSVSGTNNTGKPYVIRREEVPYHDFIDRATRDGFLVDEQRLQASRRCSESICKFVQEKIGITISSTNTNKGEVVWVQGNVERVLENDSILKLVYNDAASYTFRAMNWSYSKGNTVDSACVILTNDFEELDDDAFSLSGIAQSTINKLYVALTRSRGDIYLIKASDFNPIKSRYRKNSLQ